MDLEIQLPKAIDNQRLVPENDTSGCQPKCLLLLPAAKSHLPVHALIISYADLETLNPQFAGSSSNSHGMNRFEDDSYRAFSLLVEPFE